MINFEEIRSKLIQQAIEGRLVPQLDSEEAVEQIGDAPEEVPFEVPEKWKWCDLNMVAHLICGQAPQGSPSSLEMEGIEFHQGKKSFGEKFLRDSKVKFKNPPRIAPANSVLMSVRAPVGDVNLLTDRSIGIGRGLFALCPDSYTDLYYLYYALLNLKPFLELKATGSTFKAVKKTTVEHLSFPLPPLEEQKRIVARLEALLMELDRAEKASKDLDTLSDQLKASILQEAIQGKLVSQLDTEEAVEQIGDAPEEIPFDIPDKWKWVTIDAISTINPRIICSSDNMEVSFLPMKTVSPGYNNLISGEEKKPWNKAKSGFSKFADNDILLAKITPCFQNKKSAIAKDLLNGIGAGSTEFHVLRCKEITLNKYLLYFVKSNYFIQYGVDNFQGTAGQQRLGTKNLKACAFPLPPLEEQTRIVERVEYLFKQVDALKNAR